MFFPYSVIVLGGTVTPVSTVTIDNYAHIDMHGNQIRNFGVDVLPSRPVNTWPGRVIFNNGTKTFEGFDGTTWKILG